MVRGVGIVEARQGAADWIDAGRSGRDRDIDARIGGGHMRITADVMIFEHVMIHGVAVIAAEPVTPVVAAAAELGLAGLSVDQALVGANAKIPAANVQRLPSLHGLRPAAAVAVGAVDPVIQPPDEAIDAVLLVALGEAGEERLAHVGAAGTGRVFGVEDLRSTGDNHALAPGHHTGREGKVVEEDRRLDILAVAVGVFKILDDAARLAFAVHAERIVGHLHDPELAVRAPGKGDRILHKRLGGRQLDFEARPHFDGMQGSLRRLGLGLHRLEQLIK